MPGANGHTPRRTIFETPLKKPSRIDTPVERLFQIEPPRTADEFAQRAFAAHLKKMKAGPVTDDLAKAIEEARLAAEAEKAARDAAKRAADAEKAALAEADRAKAERDQAEKRLQEAEEKKLAEDRRRRDEKRGRKRPAGGFAGVGADLEDWPETAGDEEASEDDDLFPALSSAGADGRQGDPADPASKDK
jgi:hypothetical protein